MTAGLVGAAKGRAWAHAGGDAHDFCATGGQRAALIGASATLAATAGFADATVARAEVQRLRGILESLPTTLQEDTQLLEVRLAALVGACPGTPGRRI